MEFLLGLDMLRRHRCSINLEVGALFFHGISGQVSTPFLHEKDLPASKGGTRDLRIEDMTSQSSSSAMESESNTTSSTEQASSSIAAPPPSAAAEATTTTATSTTATSGASMDIDEKSTSNPDFEKKVQMLVEMGYPVNIVRQVLQQCDGDFELALSILTLN